ncbi:MAG: IS607 family transposase [Mycoplasmataceae bacterium]|nr:IS607 family transposase [Mycoplasmataceae bacterium]
MKKKDRKSVCYCRVSNTKQKNDLIKQEKIIREFMVSNGLICEKSYTDIASGMNENRKSFNLLIDDVMKGEISTIYISFKDRLTRFGFPYFERLFLKYNCKIIVLNSTKEDDFQQELLDDVISIIHHFAMKLYSNRRSILKNTEGLLKSTKKQ